MTKTNVMRLLTQEKINYIVKDYSNSKAVSAEEVAKALGEDEKTVFKTLVTVGKSRDHYVFVIPAFGELNLKKAAKACGEKNIEMITQKELLPLTGYVHGGCSPIGMKKKFSTFVDISALDYEQVFISGGKIGLQVGLNPNDLVKAASVTFVSLID